MKKLLSIVATLAILMLPLASSASAAWPVNGDCDHLSVGNYIGAVERNPYFVTSINANLYGDTNRFQPCTNPWPNEAGGTGQWVAFESSNTTSCKCEIVQIGYWKCGAQVSGACAGHANTLGYFWAYGRQNNCELYPGQVTPTVRWLGAVPLTGVPPGPAYHRFQITYSSAQYAIYLYIDGVRQASLSPDQVCWVHSSLNRATWAVERWDPNDGFGGPGPAWFDQMSFAHDWGQLANPYFSAGACDLDPEFYCEIPYNNKVGFYTSQQ